jgi:hypothetical protein
MSAADSLDDDDEEDDVDDDDDVEPVDGDETDEIVDAICEDNLFIGCWAFVLGSL